MRSKMQQRWLKAIFTKFNFQWVLMKKGVSNLAPAPPRRCALRVSPRYPLYLGRGSRSLRSLSPAQGCRSYRWRGLFKINFSFYFRSSTGINRIVKLCNILKSALDRMNLWKNPTERMRGCFLILGDIKGCIDV